MKRLRSSDDLHSYGEKSVVKDWGRREEDPGLQRSSSSLHRSSYYRSSDGGRKVSSSTSRYDRLEDERESSKLIRKRSDYDLESYDRRKSYDRHRDGSERGILSSSPRPGYGVDPIYRAESFSGPRRDFPKGFRSERDRPKRDGIATSWRRFGGGKDGEDSSRSSNEWGRGTRMESKDVGKSKSPQRLRDAKSPAWSKDSGSERSKSVEGKKSEDIQVESGGPSSEREEGELEPDLQSDVPSTGLVDGDKAAAKLDSSEKENKVPMDKSSLPALEKENASRVGSCEEPVEEPSKDVGSKIVDLPDCPDTSLQEEGRTRDDNGINEENVGGNDVMVSGKEGSLEDTDSMCDEKLLSSKEQGEDRDIDNQVKVEDMVMTGSVEVMAGNELPSTEITTPSLKDKGKSVALLPSSSVHVAELNLEVENKPREFVPSGDFEIEGSSTRGFQFFSTDPIKKLERVEQSTHNKPKDDKLALELSLSLPNVLLPIGSQNRAQAPGSPSHGRSIQSFASSFRTNSDGFTASMSFSGSQQFTHNPSCSLTHNGLDLEKSVGSKPLFQGVDWKALASEENKNREGSIYQGISSRENVLHQHSQSSQGNSTGQAVSQNMRVSGGSTKMPIGLERQLSFNKHLSRAQAFGSYENGPEHSGDKRQLTIEKESGTLQRSHGPDVKDQGLVIGADFAESVVTMIVSEPLQTMARRFNDMSGKHLACVKEFALDIISNPGKKWQLSALQKALQKRPDITLDMLLNANRIQLEILVALKTGLREFLMQKYDIASSDLAEILMNMRCKNLSCRSLLPVDECDCKICSQRKDFCRECMCLVCSKFDMASNTCSWVGCDVCLHWCHADCGLQESHIRNGRSASGAQGSTEMQFYCVACDHPSEMFGFVKEVFQNFVKEWTAENLSRELEYVGRIFCASEDVRGKQLYEIAVRMLSKLAGRADLQEVQNHIMNFFTESNSERPANIAIESKKELPLSKNQDACNGVAGSSHGAGWMKSVYPDKIAHLESPVNSIHDFDVHRNDNYATSMDLPKISPKEAVFDELESIVRIKQAEAKMFQARAEDARKESEALKRIAVSKSDRIEEEYSSRIAKLRLVEAEDMRKQKLEELQSLERAYQEYFNMKMRMETDIKDLLLKMEATRRNLTT